MSETTATPTVEDYTRDEALAVAEGPSTLRDLVAWFHERGARLNEMGTAAARRPKGVFIGAPACFALEEAIRPVCDAFNVYEGKGIRGCYLVGSCLQRADWRDVDIRLMLDDESFAQEFPDAGEHWEHDARWLLLTVAISEHLSKRTGLPIDFQFQPMSHANARHKGRRNAIGIRFAGERKPVSPLNGISPHDEA